MINFNGIPNNIRAPKRFVEIQNKTKSGTLSFLPSKLLILGYPDINETIGASDYETKKYLSIDDVISRFGKKSHLAWCFNKVERYSSLGEFEIFLKPLKNTGAEKILTEFFQIEGTAAEAGYLTVYISDEAFTVYVEKSEGGDEIIPKLVKAIGNKIIFPYIASESTEDEMTDAVAGSPPGTSTGATGKVLKIESTFGKKFYKTPIIDYNLTDKEQIQSPSGLIFSVNTSPSLQGVGTPDFDLLQKEFQDDNTWYTVIFVPGFQDKGITFLSELFEAKLKPDVNQIFQGVIPAESLTVSEYVEECTNTNEIGVNYVWLDNRLTIPEDIALEVAALVAQRNAINVGKPYSGMLTTAKQKPNTKPLGYSILNQIAVNGGGYLEQDKLGNVKITALFNSYRTNEVTGQPSNAYFSTVTINLVANKVYSIRNIEKSEDFVAARLVDDKTITTVVDRQNVKSPLDFTAKVRVALIAWGRLGWSTNIDDVIKSVKTEISEFNPSRVNISFEDKDAMALRIIAVLVERSE